MIQIFCLFYCFIFIISEIFSQASIQYQRLIGVLYSIEYTLEIINQILSIESNQTSYGVLYNVLTTRIKDYQIKEEITNSITTRAFQINNYFLVNKINLAGFELDLNELTLSSTSSFSKFNSFTTESTSIAIHTPYQQAIGLNDFLKDDDFEDPIETMTTNNEEQEQCNDTITTSTANLNDKSKSLISIKTSNEFQKVIRFSKNYLF